MSKSIGTDLSIREKEIILAAGVGRGGGGGGEWTAKHNGRNGVSNHCGSVMGGIGR
jgi:hypothetical protein